MKVKKKEEKERGAGNVVTNIIIETIDIILPILGSVDIIQLLETLLTRCLSGIQEGIDKFKVFFC